jgi:hypothetical protein
MFIPTAGVLIGHVSSFLCMLGVAITWGVLGPNAFDLQVAWSWKPHYVYAFAAAVGTVIAVMFGGHSSTF